MKQAVAIHATKKSFIVQLRASDLGKARVEPVARRVSLAAPAASLIVSLAVSITSSGSGVEAKSADPA